MFQLRWASRHTLSHMIEPLLTMALSILLTHVLSTRRGAPYPPADCKLKHLQISSVQSSEDSYSPCFKFSKCFATFVATATSYTFALKWCVSSFVAFINSIWRGMGWPFCPFSSCAMLDGRMAWVRLCHPRATWGSLQPTLWRCSWQLSELGWLKMWNSSWLRTSSFSVLSNTFYV